LEGVSSEVLAAIVGGCIGIVGGITGGVTTLFVARWLSARGDINFEIVNWEFAYKLTPRDGPYVTEDDKPFVPGEPPPKEAKAAGYVVGAKVFNTKDVNTALMLVSVRFVFPGDQSIDDYPNILGVGTRPEVELPGLAAINLPANTGVTLAFRGYLKVNEIDMKWLPQCERVELRCYLPNGKECKPTTIIRFRNDGS
jgi:hypothetical protein